MKDLNPPKTIKNEYYDSIEYGMELFPQTYSQRKEVENEAQNVSHLETRSQTGEDKS